MIAATPFGTEIFNGFYGVGDATNDAGSSLIYEANHAFDQSYNIAVSNSNNGLIKCKATAYQGEKVMIEIVCNYGYMLDNITITDDLGNNISVNISDYSFTMPADNINIAATFISE